MRSSHAPSLLVALTLFITGQVHAQTPVKTANDILLQQLRGIASQHHGNVTLYATNLQTHASVAISADEPVQTASVIKLAILYEAMEQVRSGRVHWDDPITVEPSDRVPGSGVLLLFDAPLRLTFKDVRTMMIVMSDNSAANLSLDHIGIANVNQEMARIGLKNTYLYKKVFVPAPAGSTMPADQKRFGLGKTTAFEMAELMTRIATCDLGAGRASLAEDHAICGVALKMLHAQFYRNAIPHYLDTMPGAQADSIANKTGSLEAVRNDVAAVSTKHGMVVISCFTYNNADHSWGSEQEGEMTIAKMARAIVQAWSPDGLAAWPMLLPSQQNEGPVH